jgi:small subunit ribosomal protein S4
MLMKAGDVISVCAKKQSREYAAPFLETMETRGLSGWLSLNREEFRGEVLHVPTREEIAPIVDEQRVVELYSK